MTGTNPTQLKLELAVRGVRLDASVREHPEFGRVARVRDYITRSVELILPEGVWVRVPVAERFTTASPYTLSVDQRGFWVTGADERCEVRVVAPPRYYDRVTASGIPMWRVGTVYGGYITLNPATGCAFTKFGTPCAFCDLPQRAGHHDAPLPVADVIETIGAAFAEGDVDSVYLDIGYVEGDDAGIRFLEPYVSAIKRHFDTLVAVQLQPPVSNQWIDYTYAIGVDGLSYSVELHDPALLAQHCPGRAEQVGRERYYEALGYAASIFPSGTVWSNLIVGLEPPSSTMAGIDRLVGLGVLPVLSIFRPLEDTPLREHPVPETAEVTPVFAHLFRAVRTAGIPMHWVRDLDAAVTPLEARFFAGEPGAASGMQQLYRTRLGGMAARNLSRLRRRLRVRRVSDSFDSSHL